MIKFLHEGLILNLPVLSDSLQLSSSKFEVTKVLDGGMGTCVQIRACDDSVYALKMIHPDLFVEEDSMQRYIEELKKWLTLSACNGIVEALMIVRINEIPCIVSRWMKGGDLTPHVRIINKEIFYKTIDRIATTLKWAYEKHHIIHRDLKPQNILMDENFDAHIGDWGLAKDLSKDIEEKNGKIVETASPTHTTDGTFLGTVSYAAPEQILGKKDIDFRADLYSLGCIMYEWEAGHLPFQGNTIKEIATRQLYQTPDKISGFLGITKFKVEPIILKCLKKNPAERYQSYDEFLADFRKVASKNANFTPFEINERYRTVRIGLDDFSNKLQQDGFNGIKGSKNSILIDAKTIEPYLVEAQHLIGLKEYEKAVSILRCFVHLDMFKAACDDAFVQNIVVNLSFAYNELHKTSNSIALLSTLQNANHKPAAYYTNLGVAYMYSRQYAKLKDICIEGLSAYPRDPDIQGNLTIAYTELGLLDDAMLSAQKRLRMGRDIHALGEASHVCFALGMNYRNIDFPLAIQNYTTSVKLDREILALNPKYTNARYNLANTLFYLKQYNESSVEIQKLRDIEGGVSAYGSFLLARNLLWTGSFKNAYEFAERMLKTFPNDVKIERVRAEALADGYSIGYVNDDGLRIVEPTSLDFFEKIVDDEKNREPSDIIYLAKYYLWMSEGDLSMREKSIGLLKWGKSLYGDDWRFDFYLASSYSLTSNLQQALLHAQESVRKAPWRDTAYNLCSQIYSKIGDLNKASEMKLKAEQLKEQKNKLYQDAKKL